MRKILIINRLGIGDVVLTTPLAQIIKEHISDVKLGFLVANKSVDILRNHPYIDDIFSYKNRQEKKLLIKKIKAKHYDMSISIDGRLSSTILAWKAGCKLLNKGFCFSIGKRHFFGRKETSMKAVDEYAMYAHTLLHINYDESEVLPIIGDCDKDKKIIINKWIEKIKKETNKIVLIVPKTAAEIKNWNVDELSKLNEYLNTKDIKPVYIGGPSDFDYIEKIKGKKINIAGKFALRDIPEIAKYASWALSMCTGPLHILSTVKDLPIVAIYGPSNPKRWAPKSAIVVQSKLPCAPCLNWANCDKLEGQRCMDEIKFERVKDVLINNNLI